MLASEGARELVLVLLDGGCLLTGVVLGPAGAPVPGARVAIGSFDEGSNEKRLLEILLQTDRGGRFRTHEVPAGRHKVFARADGLAFGQAEVEVSAIGTAHAVVRLRRGATVRGTVRDRNGKPLPHTPIQAHPDRKLPALRRGVSYGFTDSKTTADAKGRFRMTGVTPGRMWLNAMLRPDPLNENVALHDGQTFEWNPVGRPPGDLAISGVLVGPAKQKLAGWRIRTLHVNLKEAKQETATATTDAEGRFELRDLRDIPYKLRAYSPGTGPEAAVREDVRPGGPTLVWQITSLPEEWGHIVGRLLDADGGPIPDARLSAEGAGVTRAGGGREDVAGGFRITRLPPGTWTIRGRRPGYGSFDLGRHVVHPKSETDLGTRRLEARGWLLVRLGHRERAPSGDVTLRLSEVEGGSNKTAEFTTTDDGAKRSAAVPPGHYRLQVFGAEIAPVATDVRIEAGRETRLEVGLEPATTVRVRFVPDELEQEQWRDWLYIDLFDASGNKMLREVATVKQAKSYVWKIGLAPGAYEVRASSFQQARRSGRAVFRVTNGAAKPLEIRVDLAVVR